MKQVNYFYKVLVCMLFVCITACDKEDRIIEKDIPVVIKSDFSKRCPLAEILTFQNYSDSSYQIDFIDKEQNQGSIWYENENWKMTHTKIDNIDQLSPEARSSFINSQYGDAKIIDIYKTEREGIEKSLYTLHFQYLWKKVPNMEHYVFINDDGMFLTTFTWIPNNPCWFVNLSKDHFDFITEKYNGAEIRGFINNGGMYEYFILHNNIIKYVFFRGESPTESYFWKETMYELSRDTKIPDNVAKVLADEYPEFTYTNIYYIESDEGNQYLLMDKNSDNDLGYCIWENVAL